MKKNLLISLLLLGLNNLLLSQTPQTPELCLVSVNSDSLVTLKWNYDDSENIDGFMIKRIIYDGNGVVNGTLNNIEVVYDPYLRNYIDTSLDYSTISRPYFRKEEYSVSAFKEFNDTIFLSNMTPLQSTIFLNAEWDICSKTANLNWNQYENRNVIKYEIYYKTGDSEFEKITETSSSQTIFSMNDLMTETIYYFRINAVLDIQNNCQIDTSVSNIDSFYTFIPKPPENLIIYNADVEDNDKIRLNFYSPYSQGLKNYDILRNNTIIFSYDADNLVNNFIDNTSTNIQNTYLINAIDMCDKKISQSNIVENIVLNVQSKDRYYILEWNGITISNQEVAYYEIYASYGTDFTKISEVNYNTFTCNIDYYDVFGDIGNENPVEICFKIKAVANQSISDTLTSNSNIVCVPITCILAIPNAFNPLSNSNQNNHFLVKGLFIENYKITIFEETGLLLFESDNINISWDGYNKNGELMPKGTYIYYIEYTASSGFKDKINGVVNIIY